MATKPPNLPPKVRRHVQYDHPMVRDGVADPCKMVSVKQYCQSIHVIDTYVPVGTPSPPPPAPGAPAAPPPAPCHLLADPARAFTRRLIQIPCDLFDANLCLPRVAKDTFVVDAETGRPLLSARAAREDLEPISQANKKKKVEINMQWMADVVENDVIGSNSMPEEVGNGLLKMMRSEGFEMMYPILNHVSLVPLHNRLDFGFRLHQQLWDVLRKLDNKLYKRVLAQLPFPADWHARVQANMHMNQFYQGSAYSTSTKRSGQARGVLRFNRNSSAHGLEKSVENAAVVFRRQDIARMLYSVFPLLLHVLMRALHEVKMLKDLEIGSLFGYPDM